MVCPVFASSPAQVGDKRKFNTCVVTLQAKGATGELPGGDELAGAALAVPEERLRKRGFRREAPT